MLAEAMILNLKGRLQSSTEQIKVQSEMTWIK